MLAFEPMTEFLQTVGRRKLILPIYTALVQTPEGLALAKQVFERARPGSHPITAASVQRILDEARPKPAPVDPAQATTGLGK